MDWWQSSQFEGVLEIVDEQSGQLLQRRKLKGNYMLIAGEYLVEQQPGQLKVLRIVEHKTGNKTEFRIDTKFHSIADPGVGPEWIVVKDSPRFVLHNKNASPSTMTVYELAGDQLKSVANWDTRGDSLVVQHENTLLTASSVSNDVEVRDLQTFEVVGRRKLPDGLKSWNSITTCNGLFSFIHGKTGSTSVYRLDDFAPVPELTYEVTRGGAVTQRGDFTRFVLLSDRLYSPCPVVVYDTVARKIVLERDQGYGLEAIGIVDQYLLLATGEMGLTVELVDLTAPGQPSKRLQPFAWILRLMPALLVLMLLWAIAWIRATRYWPRYALLSTLTLATLFVVPQLSHAYVYQWQAVPMRPSLGYCYVTGMALIVLLSLYVVYGRGRVLVRLVPVWLLASAILATANAQLLQRTFSRTRFDHQLVAGFVAFLVHFMLLSIATVVFLRYWRFYLVATNDTRPPEPSRSIPLIDFFVQTACAAVFTLAVMPNFEVLLLAQNAIGGCIVGLFLLPAALLGLGALSARARLYKYVEALAVCSAGFLVLEFTVHLWMGHKHQSLWFTLLELLRYYTFLFLAVAAFAAIWRRAGYILTRAEPRAASAGFTTERQHAKRVDTPSLLNVD